MTTAVQEKSSTKGLNLTASRRAVLDIVMAAGRPMKAYDILSELQKVIAHAKPPTVYRALDYLIKHHLLHRVNDQNAYVFCQQDQKCFHNHPMRYNVLFSCQTCGSVKEESNGVLTAVISEMAADLGFRTHSRIIEYPGTCGACYKQQAPEKEAPHCA